MILSFLFLEEENWKWEQGALFLNPWDLEQWLSISIWIEEQLKGCIAHFDHKVLPKTVNWAVKYVWLTVQKSLAHSSIHGTHSWKHRGKNEKLLTTQHGIHIWDLD